MENEPQNREKKINKEKIVHLEPSTICRLGSTSPSLTPAKEINVQIYVASGAFFKIMAVFTSGNHLRSNHGPYSNFLKYVNSTGQHYCTSRS